MKASNSRIFMLVLVVLTLSLLFAGAALAQDAPPTPTPEAPPACVPDAQTACVKIVFYPSTLVGDLMVGDTPATQVQQGELWVTFPSPAAGQSQSVVVTNIHDGNADNGRLYIYPDITREVTSPSAPGQTKTVTLYPVKKYIRGKVDAKCSPNAVAADEEVACAVTIDGTPQQASLAAGQKATYILDPGKHTIQFDLAGASAALWSPQSVTKALTVTAGSFPQTATAKFLKSAHVVATLARAAEGWVGDFYMDGVLAQSQAASIEGWAAGNKTHKIEVRNISNPISPGIHPYKDAETSFYASTAANKTITVQMTGVSIKSLQSPFGFCGENYTLNTSSYVGLFPNWMALAPEIAEENADHLQYIITLDSVNIGDTRPYRQPAFRATTQQLCGAGSSDPFYVVMWILPLGKLPAGTHTLHIQLVSDAAIFDGVNLWEPGVLLDGDSSFEVVPDQPAP